MKNLLLATSALVATAGFAAADVNVGGFGYLGVTHTGGTDAVAASAGYAAAADAVVAAQAAVYDATTAADKAAAEADLAAAEADLADETAPADATAASNSVAHAVRVTFGASVETDSGITFGASSRITVSDNNDNGQLSHNKITVSTGGLTMAVGATHGAMKTQARVATFHGFNDGGGLYAGGATGVDNNVGLGDGGNNVLVTYAMNGFTLAAASDVAGTTTEFGASYAANGLSVGAGIDNNNQWMAKVGYSANGMSINVGTNDNNDIVVVGSYAASDALSLGLGYDKDATGNNVGLNVAYSLGGGATMTANVARLHGTSAAGLGVQFSF